MPITVSDHMLHPGEILAEIYMKDRGFNQSTLAAALDCSPRKINEIVNGKRGISADFALALAKVFDTTADMWVRLQADFDLYMARKRSGGSSSGYDSVAAMRG